MCIKRVSQILKSLAEGNHSLIAPPATPADPLSRSNKRRPNRHFLSGVGRAETNRRFPCRNPNLFSSPAERRAQWTRAEATPRDQHQPQDRLHWPWSSSAHQRWINTPPPLKGELGFTSGELQPDVVEGDRKPSEDSERIGERGGECSLENVTLRTSTKWRLYTSMQYDSASWLCDSWGV